MLLTPVAVAGMIAISKSRVHELLSAGELSSDRIGRSRRAPQRFFREYVDRLINQAAQQEPYGALIGATKGFGPPDRCPNLAREPGSGTKVCPLVELLRKNAG